MSNQEFLKTAYNSLQQYRGLQEMDAVEFYRFLQAKLKVVDMDPAYSGATPERGLFRR